MSSCRDLSGAGRARFRGRRSAVLLAVAAIVLAACAPAEPPLKPPAKDGGLDPDLAAQADVAAYAGLGPYEVGVTTVTLEAGRQAEVWYPASDAGVVGLTPETYFIRDFLSVNLDRLLAPGVNPPFETIAYRGAAPEPGPARPLVLFSHGSQGYRLQSTKLTTHLASWGFVVISPDYFERGLQYLLGEPLAPTRTSAEVTQQAVDAAIALNASGPLAGLIDTSRLFPIGHSAGGSQSTQLAGSRTDVQSWIAMAAGINLTPTVFNPMPTVPPALSDTDKSVMWITGADDGVVQLPGVVNAFEYTAGERKLVVLPGVGHNNAVTDLCELGRDEGGLIGLAESGGLVLPDNLKALANDGCASPPNFRGEDVWPVAHHFVTAELRYRSGLDAEPVGLGLGVIDQFGPVVPQYQHDE